MIEICVRDFASSDMVTPNSTELNIFPCTEKTKEAIKSVFNELQENGFDVMLCRDQANDNLSLKAV